ncbi:MAG: class I SAM-dependent methyltransferase [Chloroflexota bacterium]
MDEMQLLIDLHIDGERQGPGGDDETRLAVTLSGLRGKTGLRVADIGCGTGASTLVLAAELDAHITAVDFLPPFLERLDTATTLAGVTDQITTHTGSMDNLPFEDGSLDAIWSEGAIYNMGFEAGVAAWRRYLKPGGVLAVSELTWITDQRPDDLQAHWDIEYSQVDTASAKIAILERHGYTVLGYFPLGAHCWLANYYRPMQARFDAILDKYDHDEAAQALINAEQVEINLYEANQDFVSYGFYIAQKTGD